MMASQFSFYLTCQQNWTQVITAFSLKHFLLLDFRIWHFYITSCSFAVLISRTSSSPWLLNNRVTQGLVLVPFSFLTAYQPWSSDLVSSLYVYVISPTLYVQNWAPGNYSLSVPKSYSLTVFPVSINDNSIFAVAQTKNLSIIHDFLFHSTFSHQIHDPTSHCIQNLTVTHLPTATTLSHPPCSLTWTAAGASSLLPLPQLNIQLPIAPSQAIPTHSIIEQQPFYYAHGFCWLEVQKEREWRLLLPVPMIFGAPARMAQLSEPETAGSERYASKEASSLRCLPSRLRWLKNRINWGCGLNLHMRPL